MLHMMLSNKTFLVSILQMLKPFLLGLSCTYKGKSYKDGEGRPCDDEMCDHSYCKNGRFGPCTEECKELSGMDRCTVSVTFISSNFS